VTRPCLVTGARLVYDGVRAEHVLLLPEAVVRLNYTAAEVLGLCDGEHSLDEIVVSLSARYERHDISGDVRELLDRLASRGVVVDAGA
jgi:pyrroloquinoline quinone biosynthesis protein D